MKNKQKLLATPYIFWAVAFIIIPLLMVFYYGFTDTSRSILPLQNITGDRIARAHEGTWSCRSRLSLISTLICLLLAYPLAMILAE